RSADAVAAELAHDREAMTLGEALDRRADIAEVRAGLDGTDAAPHRLVGHFAQPASLDRRRADIEHATGVAVETILDDGDVDIDDVASLELLVAWDAVTDDMVDRRADRCGIRLITGRGVVERRRNRALHADHVL